MKSCVPKEETPQKCVAKIQYDHRIWKVKKVSLPIASKPLVPSNNFDEAKAAGKARKRKERQESVSFQYQDRKVIRSNSEERPVPGKKSEENNNGIRRVSSSGDFPKSTSEEKDSSPHKKYEQIENIYAYDDNEHDKRRSHERFARPHIYKTRKCPNKRLKNRSSKLKYKMESQDSFRKHGSNQISEQIIEHQRKHDEDVTSSIKFLDLHQPETERAPSPVHSPGSPVLDFATLHKQVDCSEPLLSQPDRHLDEDFETMPSQFIASNILRSSPRNSIIATHRIYLDPDVAQNSVPLNPVDERIQKLNKQINSCKKKIIKYEADFHVKNGVKPSQLDKLNDENIKRLYVELNKLKKEQKQLSDVSVGYSKINLGSNVEQDSASITLQETVNNIEQKLLAKRESANRNLTLEDMTSEQLIEEKIAMQKALLFLESIHGRPQSKEDRDIVRPFYDRYRLLKRMVSKITNAAATGELPTIHENEAMHFVTPTSSSNETESEKTETPTTGVPSDKSKDFIHENFHSLTKSELIKQLKIATEDKKELRRKIKEFEITTQIKTCRLLTAEDKKPMEELYIAYKKVKARLRLLDALVAKQN